MMSSPGYNMKNMEAPLLQNASRMNKSKNIHHQHSTDSFIMSNIGRTVHRGVHAAKREDSSVSSDSFSQTSSPGFNSKLLEAPLLAHAVKLHTRKAGVELLMRYAVIWSSLHLFRRQAAV